MIAIPLVLPRGKNVISSRIFGIIKVCSNTFNPDITSKGHLSSKNSSKVIKKQCNNWAVYKVITDIHLIAGHLPGNNWVPLLVISEKNYQQCHQLPPGGIRALR